MIWSALLLPIIITLVTLVAGAYVAEYLNQLTKLVLTRRAERADFNPLMPLYRASLYLTQQTVATERPDHLNHRMAPALFFGLAALGLAVVPWSSGFIPVNLVTSVVIWGAVEVLSTVVIFLYGWSANTHLSLLGAYRYVALGLSYMLVSMFVLIAVALPAESLQFNAIVESQRHGWNLIRQPLGLPLFLVVGLGLTFWGPLNFASPRNLGCGLSADTSGTGYLLWEFARRSMLVAFSFIAASAFLGGWLGPVLPGPVWLVLKALLILFVLLILGRCLPVITPDKFVTLAWVVLLPLAFMDLIWAGALALW